MRRIAALFVLCAAVLVGSVMPASALVWKSHGWSIGSFDPECDQPEPYYIRAVKGGGRFIDLRDATVEGIAAQYTAQFGEPLPSDAFPTRCP